MSFEINGTASLVLQRSLKNASKEIEASMLKLSYGKQTKAVEDAANLIISEEMEAQRRGSMQAAENAQTGINMLSTAESALGSINDNMQRIRELKIQRENGTYGEEDRAAIDAEIGQLTEEIDRVAESTSFNDIKLLDGSNTDVSLQIGPDGDVDTNVLNLGDTLGSGVKTSDFGLGAPSEPDFLDKLDDAINTVNGKRADIGAQQNRLQSAVNNLYVRNENITAAQSRIIDTDVAAEVSNLTQNQILQNSSALLLAQANQSASIASILL